jgi:uncharacterized membrane protein YhaH (DUF805 family)
MAMKSPRILLPINELLNPYGRITRLQYVVHLALYTAILLPLAGVLIVVGIGGFFEAHPIVVLCNVATIGLAGSFLMFCLHAKRLHDVGLPAVIGLVMLTGGPAVLGVFAVRLLNMQFIDSAFPFITLASGVFGIFSNASIGIGGYLMMAPGQKGDNPYGLDPLDPL